MSGAACLVTLSCANLICTQVWVVAEVREGKVYWRADADSLLTKVSLILEGVLPCNKSCRVLNSLDFVKEAMHRT